MLTNVTAHTVTDKEPSAPSPKPLRRAGVCAPGQGALGFFAFHIPCSSPGQTAHGCRRNRVKARRGSIDSAIQMSDPQGEQERTVGPSGRRNPANAIVRRIADCDRRATDGAGIANLVFTARLGEYSPAFSKLTRGQGLLSLSCYGSR